METSPEPATDSLDPDEPPPGGLLLALRGQEPRRAPRFFPFLDCETLLFGRGEAELVHREVCPDEGRRLRVALADAKVSGRHARCVRLLDRWTIEDLGSRNGTRLNGRRLDAATPLAAGDVVEIGSHFFVFTAAPARPDVPSSCSPGLARLYADLATTASTDLPVLVLGETGAGKEMTARHVHEHSGRRGPFVAVNCAALPEGLLEASLFGHRRGAFTGANESRPGLIRSAHGGTLFLDEIGELPLLAQAALLRVLQEREVVAVGGHEAVAVDVRVVAATNRDLVALVQRGEFRADLYARLAGHVVVVPPLRERRADLGVLVAALLERYAPNGGRTTSFAPQALRTFFLHDWPQNVRELEMAIRLAGARAGWARIELIHLPEALQRTLHVEAHRERAHLTELMRTHEGNVTAVARELSTSRSHVHRLARRHGLALERFRR